MSKKMQKTITLPIIKTSTTSTENASRLAKRLFYSVYNGCDFFLGIESQGDECIQTADKIIAYEFALHTLADKPQDISIHIRSTKRILLSVKDIHTNKVCSRQQIAATLIDLYMSYNYDLNKHDCNKHVPVEIQVVQTSKQPGYIREPDIFDKNLLHAPDVLFT